MASSIQIYLQNVSEFTYVSQNAIVVFMKTDKRGTLNGSVWRDAKSSLTAWLGQPCPCYLKLITSAASLQIAGIQWIYKSRSQRIGVTKGAVKPCPKSFSSQVTNPSSVYATSFTIAVLT